MTVERLALILGCETAVGGESLQKQVKHGYCGDLLSWVMGRAGSGSAWITVMGNINAAAVAVLADVACMILAEGAEPDRDTLIKAGENGIPVLKSEKSAYDLAVGVHEALLNE